MAFVSDLRNYQEWSRLIITAINLKNKVEFTNGSVSKLSKTDSLKVVKIKILILRL